VSQCAPQRQLTLAHWLHSTPLRPTCWPSVLGASVVGVDGSLGDRSLFRSRAFTGRRFV
jgi:hypothetical protein